MNVLWTFSEYHFHNPALPVNWEHYWKLYSIDAYIKEIITKPKEIGNFHSIILQ